MGVSLCWVPLCAGWMGVTGRVGWKGLGRWLEREGWVVTYGRHKVSVPVDGDDQEATDGRKVVAEVRERHALDYADGICSMHGRVMLEMGRAQGCAVKGSGCRISVAVRG